MSYLENTFKLTDKTAYITGGSSGIGLAVAKAFISCGVDTVIADIVDVEAIAENIGGHYVESNVADEQSVKDSLQKAATKLGKPLDIVVLNAGVGDVGPNITETHAKLNTKVTSINQWGVLWGLKYAPEHMNDNGSIISTSSMAAFINIPGSGVYSASKRAVVSLSEMAALELGHRNIRVNCVCPGYTDTAMGSGDEGKLICEAFTALGRVAKVEDLVGAYLFLASDASRYMTGQALKVDGGWHCGPTARLLEIVTGSQAAPN